MLRSERVCPVSYLGVADVFVFMEEVDVIVKCTAFRGSISAQRGVMCEPIVPQVTEVRNDLLFG